MRLAMAVVLGVAAPFVYAAGPYAGEESRPIKSLSPAEVDGYLAGRGMGFAKAAEINGYPGPMHVLELADALQLSTVQRGQSEALFERMRSQASALGGQLVRKERELEDAFSTGHVSPEAVDALTAEIARLMGKLRAAHLRAHLEQRAILTPQQTRSYSLLRGDARGHAGHEAHGGAH